MSVLPLEDVNKNHGGGGGNEVVVSRSSSERADRRINLNQYATKKTIAQGMLDIALLTANAAQLKYVLLSDGKHQFYMAMLVLISLSIALQVLVGIGQMILVNVNVTKDDKAHFADILNNIVTALVFGITVINVIISAFGIEDSQMARYPTPSAFMSDTTTQNEVQP